MKIINIFLVLILITIAACNNKEEPEHQGNTQAGRHKIKVIEFTDASTYTYILGEEAGEKYWIAVPAMPVQEGEILFFSKSIEMKNFKSPTLNKEFESILFVEDISRNTSTETPVSSHHTSQTKQEVKVEPLKDGKTIEQVYAQKNELSGKKIKVKGKVVKYNSGIMDRNWIHIQDGTGSANDFDLLITTTEEANVGDIIIAEGIIGLNKDFGAGYSYDIVLENAKIKK